MVEGQVDNVEHRLPDQDSSFQNMTRWLTWAEIDLDALAHNVRAFKRHVGPATEVMAVVKANAYGHGAVPVSRVALESGATRLAVARLDEGVQLRRAGIDAPILVMGYTLPARAELLARWDLTPTINTLEGAQALSAAAVASGRVASFHVKIDTGMGRYGLLPEEVVSFICAVSAMNGLRWEGLYTHFAVADLADKDFTRRQFSLYRDVVTALTEAGHPAALKHIANSAGTLDLPKVHLDAVRIGIAMYGLHPSNEVEPAIPLRPLLTLKSRVARVRTLPTGASISYGRTYITQRPTPVALIPVGYGDGYHRLMSNRGEVLIRGGRAPIVGRVCMDQFVVDISGIRGVTQDDEVVLIGRQGQEAISAERVATWAETINYEVTTSILPRVTRVFLRGGRVVGEEPL